MDYSFVFLWLIAFLTVILIIAGLLYLSYWIPKMLGYKRVGVAFASILTIGVLTGFLSFVFEDVLFFRSDAQGRLEEHYFNLSDDFEIVKNEMSGINDFYHLFELKISKEDKERLAQKIRSAENYQDHISETSDIRGGKPRYSDHDTSFTINYKDKCNYIYEYYKPNKKGYKPTWVRISVSKSENRIFYQYISE